MHPCLQNVCSHGRCLHTNAYGCRRWIPPEARGLEEIYKSIRGRIPSKQAQSVHQYLTCLYVSVLRSIKMTGTSLQSTVRLVTGYEIPIVGYGVRNQSPPGSKSLQETQSDPMNAGISNVCGPVLLQFNQTS